MAMDKPGGQELAIGASRMGTRISYAAQKASARATAGWDVGMVVVSFTGKDRG
jgi:hypothetical protein